MPDPTSVQNTFTAKDFLIPALTILGSFAASWIAARLALGNYYKQQIWQRKAEAYSTIFEAIQVIERWHEQHLDASIRGAEVDAERKAKLRQEANKAEEDLEKCLGGRVWILPPAFTCRAWRITTDLKQAAHTHDNFSDFLSHSISIIESATSDLQALVHKDLGIRTLPSFISRLQLP